MTTSTTSSKPPLAPTPGPFYEASFQNTITAGTGWDKNLSEILHSKFRMPYSASKEIASAYAELLHILETSDGSFVGFYYRSDLKQILSTAENYVRFSKWYREDSPVDYRELVNEIRRVPSRPNQDIVDFSKFRNQSKTMSWKIETEISLLRDGAELEQRYKDFDKRRLLAFIICVSKILAEVSLALFAFTTLLAVVLPWHWRFIISKAGLALAIGAIAYLGFDVSKRMQRYVLAVQNLYMHHFLFIWGWNDLKACLTHIAEKDVPVSDLQDMRNFVWSFQSSFFGKEEELQRLQMQISASLTSDTKKWFEW
ncbi:uncharacterized protein EV420DRAFT_1767425 [Desarmillaria tabescens]|uniref:Uncharacterized protein n=1 Tax=Armillaria tabescens TaxID=1929756 RepID=A0AA39JWE7_ARMTA|nr:uncharacterized protein EV420DRAFT_1767425 [Desarmillaria tabescens]KAK0447838.1 hypothetical protein EV420DRAFT_1767425 [Desarmillaria tabescens]